ncbi:MAG: thiosulfohydrolase SoxB [Salinisphaera sp.]|nr:thiosulfohydrolase SoxB [Salinisphaera sp.]
MSMTRRHFIKLMQLAGAAGLAPGLARAANQPPDPYHIPLKGNVRLLHLTDTHAQLLPIYYREPNVNIGVGPMRGRAPHIVGEHLLERFDIRAGTNNAHALTYLDFAQAAEQFGPLGGFAHLKTLIDSLREQAGPGNSLLLDGGDLVQASGTAHFTRGHDMIAAGNRLGIDIMTGHWEFAYPEEEIRDLIDAFNGEFLAQNVFLSQDAIFFGAKAFDEATGRVFKPYSVKEVGGRRIGVIGQAFPYTPIANPAYFIPNWTFGIHESELQRMVEVLCKTERVDAVVLLSHNGMDVDLKLASRVSGIDVILGGHTHDAMPEPSLVENKGGRTLVTNSGTNGKFLAVVDLDVGNGQLRGFHHQLLPVFSNLIEPDPGMAKYIEQVRAPYTDKLNEELAVADELLYRRGNFNGTMDQVICDAQRAVGDAEIAFSPGFRWGPSVLPGQGITMDDVMAGTAITYPETYVQEMTGEQIKLIMEDVCDNLFNRDPYYQQGGDMVRVGGMDYTCDPAQTIGHRISDLRLDNGKSLSPTRKYKVAGWATVNSKSPGPPIWEVVADYLRDQKVARIGKLNTPRLKNVGSNPGVEDYRG